METFISKTPQEAKQAFLALATPRDVADLFEVPYGTLIYHLYRTPESRRYITFEISKKSGGKRLINAPDTTIKILQRKLNFVLQQVYEPRPSVQGFLPNRSIVTNASKHSAKKHVLNLDLNDYFPSINFGRVRGMFIARPYSLPVAVSTVLAQICCHRNQLPQGAPTSPIISNMVSSRLDTQLQRLAQAYRCTYTRYSDDITISTTQGRFPEELASLDLSTIPPKLVIGRDLIQIIVDNGFAINMRKARLQLRHDRHEVTGLTANQFPNLQRRFINQIRAMLHAWEKFGHDAAEAHFQSYYNKKHRASFKRQVRFREVVRGKLNYLSMVRGSLDPIFTKYASQLAALDPDYKPIYEQKIQRQLNKANPENAVWVLEGRNKQGTGFFLQNKGFITCWHVLDSDLVAFKPQSHTRRFPVSTIASDPDIDLAITEFEVNDPIELRQGNSNRLRIGDPITLLGFPNYDRGHTIQVFRGQVTGFKDNFFSCRRIMIDAPIIAGNSGGPVLNAHNEVIGVAYRGSDRSEQQWDNESGVTPIESLDRLRVGV